MIIKLIKHELKYFFRQNFILLVAMISLSLIGVVSFSLNSSRSFFSSSSFVVVFLLTITIIFRSNIESMTKRVFGNRGYLLFSTPAKASEIVLSKVLTNMITNIVVIIIQIISSLFFVGFNLETLRAIFNFLAIVIDEQVLIAYIWLLIWYVFAALLILAALSLFSATFLNTVFISNKKKSMGIVIAYILIMLFSVIAGALLGLVLGNIKDFDQYLRLRIGITALFLTIASAILFIVSTQLIKKRLDLR